mgnify:CR=1 FL=1
MLKDLIVFQKAYEILKWIHIVTAKFPKSEKFVLAQKTENAALDFLEAVIEANESVDKTEFLERAVLVLEKLRIWLRLSFELRYISIRQYEHGSKMIDEAGRLLGGWNKKFGGAGRL